MSKCLKIKIVSTDYQNFLITHIEKYTLGLCTKMFSL